MSNKPHQEPALPDETTLLAVPQTKILGRAQILDAEDLKTEVVATPEWGGSVIVRCLTGIERDAYEAGIVASSGSATAEYNLTNLRAKLVARTVVDERGRRLFSDEDVVALGAKNASVLDRVFSVAQRLSGLSVADVDALVEQLGNDPSADSGSA